jgi:hypothetical protein
MITSKEDLNRLRQLTKLRSDGNINIGHLKICCDILSIS